ncbi:MAG: hypothetical protein AseanaTS_02660 [Candidatus Pelagadaptatus aseana]|uniref:type IV pilus assembly protein FimV n=1 Tax=Candidatus Pelagadaptatus aseana TaxID=3120508 RepID=UPI0039B20DCE
MTSRVAPNNRQPHHSATSPTKQWRERALCTAIRSLSTGLLLTGASQLQALGLGDLSHSSYLGQPLTASVVILDSDGDYGPGDIKIRQISATEAADTLDLDILNNNYRLKLTPTTMDGELQVQIRSRQPINEPFVDLVLELSWSGGQVFREYTLLMDPPPVAAKPATASTPAPTKPATRTTAVKARPNAPFEPGTLGGSYTIRSGDTLSQIAEQWRLGSDHSLAGTKQWLLANNPRAFLNGDPNQLMLGARLQLPSGDNLPPADLQPGWSDTRPANVAHNIPLAPGERQTIPATGTTPADTQSNSKHLSGKLHLGKQAVVAPEELQDMVDAKPIEEIRELIHITQETADRIIRENEDLRRRIENIENSDYIKSMEELIALQRDEIESLRANLSSSADIQPADYQPALVSTSNDPVPAQSPEPPSAMATTSSTVTDPTATAPANPVSQLTEKQPAAGPWFWVLSGLSALLAMIIAVLVAFRMGQRSQETARATADSGSLTTPVLENSADDDLGPVSAPEDLGEEDIIPLQLDGGDEPEDDPSSLDDIDLLPEDEELLTSSDNHPQTLQVPRETILDNNLQGLDSIILPAAESEIISTHVDFSATLSSDTSDASDPESLEKPEVPEELPFAAEELEDSELTFDLELNEDFVDSQTQAEAPAFDQDLDDIDLNLSALEENIFKDNRDDVDELISRAMIFASFGDFDKAEETLIDELALYPDETRISDALEQFAKDRKKAEDQ